MNTTPTPRTDQIDKFKRGVHLAYFEMRELVRDLERELADSQATIAGLKLALDKAMAENLAMRDKLK